MNETQIFSSYEAFLNREDKSINGVSPEFAEQNPSYEEMNATNKGCFDCLHCVRCENCAGCDYCIDCKDVVMIRTIITEKTIIVHWCELITKTIRSVISKVTNKQKG